VSELRDIEVCVKVCVCFVCVGICKCVDIPHI